MYDARLEMALRIVEVEGIEKAVFLSGFSREELEREMMKER